VITWDVVRFVFQQAAAFLQPIGEMYAAGDLEKSDLYPTRDARMLEQKTDSVGTHDARMDQKTGIVTRAGKDPRMQQTQAGPTRDALTRKRPLRRLARRML